MRDFLRPGAADCPGGPEDGKASQQRAACGPDWLLQEGPDDNRFPHPVHLSSPNRCASATLRGNARSRNRVQHACPAALRDRPIRIPLPDCIRPEPPGLSARRVWRVASRPLEPFSHGPDQGIWQRRGMPHACARLPSPLQCPRPSALPASPHRFSNRPTWLRASDGRR